MLVQILLTLRICLEEYSICSQKKHVYCCCWVSEVLVAQLCPTLCHPMWSHGARRATLSMEFSKQEQWSECHFPSPGDLPNPGIKPRSPTDSLPTEPSRKPCCWVKYLINVNSIQLVDSGVQFYLLAIFSLYLFYQLQREASPTVITEISFSPSVLMAVALYIVKFYLWYTYT